MQQHPGATFQEADVVGLYKYRPPYPQRLFDVIAERAPAHDAVLDVGCGPGKIARELTARFSQVTAVDPSAKMIELGRSLPSGQAENLHWVNAPVEGIAFPMSYDVVVAANSIHWIDCGVFFPKLYRYLRPKHLFAVVSGDAPYDPPWEDDWRAFLRKWVTELTGDSLDSPGWTRKMNKHRPYLDIDAEMEFDGLPFCQSVEDFILCQHSRETFACSRLADSREAFDQELRELLSPYADENGQITFQTKTFLTLGTVRA